MALNMMRIQVWLQQYDYEALEGMAARGYNFNSCESHSAFKRAIEMTPLTFVVRQMPRVKDADITKIARLVCWLIAHGADPTLKDEWANLNMWETLELARKDGEYAAGYKELYVKLRAP